MPKRACPFEGDLLPQLKVHVEEKHVNNGVSSDQRMRNVYDRTLSLLKEGAKALVHKLNTSAQMDLPSPQRLSPCKFRSTSNLKQMLLTDKLQLKTSNKIVNNVPIDLCGCGQLIDRSTGSACYYCDQGLCASCQAVCANCTELFCQNCSLPVYNCDEQIMCLNCYR